MRLVVTGASSGIGAALARALAEEGRTLHLLGRNRAALTERAEEARALRADAEVHAFDVTDDEAVHRFAGGLADGPDVLIHSAGVVTLGRHETLAAAALDEQYRVNVRAPFVLTQALLAGLRRARGLVVYVNSGSGLRAKAAWGGYAASKFALKALADSLREEESANGVRVTSVYPGRTATPMQREVRRQEGGTYDESAYAPAEDVAEVVAGIVQLPQGTTVPDVSVRSG